MQGVIKRNQIKIIDIPYNDFTWDDGNKIFQTNSPVNIPSGWSYVAILVEPTNGTAIMTARRTPSGYVQVMGWLNKTATAVGSDYIFRCQMILI